MTSAKITFSPCTKSWLETLRHKRELTYRLSAILGFLQIDGATITRNTGYWKGQRETSYSLDIVGIDGLLARRLAELLKTAFNQESVLVEMRDIPVEFV